MEGSAAAVFHNMWFGLNPFPQSSSCSLQEVPGWVSHHLIRSLCYKAIAWLQMWACYVLWVHWLNQSSKPSPAWWNLICAKWEAGAMFVSASLTHYKWERDDVSLTARRRMPSRGLCSGRQATIFKHESVCVAEIRISRLQSRPNHHVIWLLHSQPRAWPITTTVTTTNYNLAISCELILTLVFSLKSINTVTHIMHMLSINITKGEWVAVKICCFGNAPANTLQEEFHCKIVTITSLALAQSQLALHFLGCGLKIENSKQWKKMSLSTWLVLMGSGYSEKTDLSNPPWIQPCQ